MSKVHPRPGATVQNPVNHFHLEAFSPLDSGMTEFIETGCLTEVFYLLVNPPGTESTTDRGVKDCNVCQISFKDSKLQIQVLQIE